MYRAGFIPSLAKEGWPRQGPGWFAPQRGEIPQLEQDRYRTPLSIPVASHVASRSATGLGNFKTCFHKPRPSERGS